MADYSDVRGGAPITANLHIESLGAILTGADDDPGWVIERVFPADGYGVLAAPFKAGKTWMVADLIVSVGSGGRWCGVWPTPVRRVLVFFGEGGRRKMVRRLRAVADHKGTDLGALPVRVSLVPPLITDVPTLVAIEHEVQTERPGLVVIDPWYLSAPGVRMADLVNVGAAVRELQLICQREGAALLLTHHWNQTGQGGGAGRMSGAGLAEWGRVLINVEVVTRTDTESSSRVVLRVDMTGDETADQTIALVRDVGVVGDAADLTAPMTYRIVATDLPLDLGAKPTTERLVLAALGQRRGDFMSAHELGDVLAGWGYARRKRTILEVTAELVASGALDKLDGGRREADRWALR